jgi:hypothetical protein
MSTCTAITSRTNQPRHPPLVGLAASIRASLVILGARYRALPARSTTITRTAGELLACYGIPAVVAQLSGCAPGTMRGGGFVTSAQWQARAAAVPSGRNGKEGGAEGTAAAIPEERACAIPGNPG